MKVQHTIKGMPKFGPYKPPAPKPPGPPTKLELANARKAAAGHRQLEADHRRIADDPEASEKERADHTRMAETHRHHAEAAEATVTRAPKT